MTLSQTILASLTLTAAIGAGSYQGHQASQLRARLQVIRQQQSLLREQIQMLQEENNDMITRLTSLAQENSRLKSEQNPAELSRLRGEIVELENATEPSENDPIETEASRWLNLVLQLKQYAARHLEECAPELQFLTNRDWLKVVKAPDLLNNLGIILQQLNNQAAGRFAQMVAPALKKYAAEHNGQFPNGLSQLQAYCDPMVEEFLRQHYEIRPASVLSVDEVKTQHIKTDWVIFGKDRVSSLTAAHIAIYAEGYVYAWRSSSWR